MIIRHKGRDYCTAHGWGPTPCPDCNGTPPHAPREPMPDLDKMLKEALAATNGHHDSPLLDQLIDWSEFWTKDHRSEDWLLWPLIPAGRQVALYAPAKTGKSIVVLAGVAALATGRSIFGGTPQPPRHVLYLDFEMTETDLYERLEALGYGPDDDFTHLHYACLPSLPPLNEDRGATAVCTLARAVEAEAVIIDTLGRAVVGEENSSNPYLEYARTTGLALKAAGTSVLRTDHAGKDKDRGQRGSSAKNDDVDVVLRLDPCEGGWTLKRTHARMGWVPEQLIIKRNNGEGGTIESLTIDNPGADSYLEGTKALAKRLTELGIVGNDGTAAAQHALRQAGEGARRIRVSHALRWLRELEQQALTVAGTHPGTLNQRSGGNPVGNPGTQPPLSGGTQSGNAGNASAGQSGNVPPLLRGNGPSPDPETEIF